VQSDRNQLAQALDQGLEDGADRRDDDLDRAALAVHFGVSQPSEHGQAAADGVAARAEPLVRQRLPGGELGHCVLRDEAAQRGGEIFSFPAGRRHGQHGPARSLGGGPGQGCDEWGAQPGRRGEVDQRLSAVAGNTDGFADCSVGTEQIEDSGEAHGSRNAGDKV
jgi:hypothetical protein